MAILYRVILPAGALLLASPANPATIADPLRFFEGRTESEGTIKVMLKKPYRTFSVGRGRIEPDGTLVLVQQVKDAGQQVKERRWKIRRVGPNRYTGTMTEATGPVAIDQVGDRFRFRFKMKGSLSAEQWVTPHADGASAASHLTVRKLGMTVATSDGTIRKLD